VSAMAMQSVQTEMIGIITKPKAKLPNFLKVFSITAAKPVFVEFRLLISSKSDLTSEFIEVCSFIVRIPYKDCNLMISFS
jgi:hypothetical protein